MHSCPDPGCEFQPLPPAAFPRLESIYGQVEHALAAAAPRCDLSGRCCDFESSGHVLFATDLETRYLLARTPGADPAPSTAPAHRSWAPNGKLCPFWRNRLCTAREGRPLGCRIFFCDPAYRDPMPELYERFQGEIRALHDDLGLTYRYAPLVLTLREIHDRDAGRAGRGVDSA